MATAAAQTVRFTQNHVILSNTLSEVI
jgi:hypothetical protein